MSIFDTKRLTQSTLQLDLEGLRHGWYSDKYFENISLMLGTLSSQGAEVGDRIVEAQWFNRRSPYTLIAGVDIALEMLRHCTGYHDTEGNFINTYTHLEVEAVHDGVFTHYHDDPAQVQPVLKVRGVYRHFAMLETPTLGYLTRLSRIATNVYQVLVAAAGRQVLFFPARFDLPATQAADGYAYHLAIQRYNHNYKANLRSAVSTDAQAAWWGGGGGGTVPHAVIACFLGDTPAAMLAFAATQPLHVPRIALVDFQNDCIGTSLAVARAMFERYYELKTAGNTAEAECYRLNGVRLDTAGNLRDAALEPTGDPQLDFGVNPRLVSAVRQALDHTWQSWNLPTEHEDDARTYCQQIKIVATGGFNQEKIAYFTRLGVPVDIYGVGSSLLANDKQTNTDFTTDVVRVKVDGVWQDMAKVGRRPCDNPNLIRIT